MYTLRTVRDYRSSSSDPYHQEIINVFLGKSYTVLKGDDNESLLDILGKRNVSPSAVSSVIIDSDGNEHLIYRNLNPKEEWNTYFIMTDDGSTFERIKN